MKRGQITFKHKLNKNFLFVKEIIIQSYWGNGSWGTPMLNHIKKQVVEIPIKKKGKRFKRKTYNVRRKKS